MVERVLSMHEALGSIPCFSNFASSAWGGREREGKRGKEREGRGRLYVTCAHKDIPTYPCPRIRYGIVPLVRHRDYFPSPQVFSNHTVL